MRKLQYQFLDFENIILTKWSQLQREIILNLSLMKKIWSRIVTILITNQHSYKCQFL